MTRERDPRQFAARERDPRTGTRCCNAAHGQERTWPLQLHDAAGGSGGSWPGLSEEACAEHLRDAPAGAGHAASCLEGHTVRVWNGCPRVSGQLGEHVTVIVRCR